MGTFSRVDLDDVFSYNTVKVVRMRDRRLGILYLLFLFLIFIYIIVYNFLFEKKYLKVDDPSGSFRFSLQRPKNPKPLPDLPYCLQTNPTYNNFQNEECRYYEDSLVLYPRTEESAMLVTTRMTQTEYRADCDFTTPDCSFENITEPLDVFVADIDRYTIMIDHAFYATNIETQRNAQQLTGKLYDVDGNEMKLESPNQFGEAGKLDILELGTILKAAGIESLDILSDVTDNTDKSIRYNGAILIAIIEYDNTFSFNTSEIRYKMTVRWVRNSEFKSEEQLFSSVPQQFLMLNRHGIRILFQREGIIGKFDFQTMLINLIAGSALVSFSTICVDILAVYILPQRKVYESYKYQPTPDIPDIEKAEQKVDGYSSPP